MQKIREKKLAWAGGGGLPVETWAEEKSAGKNILVTFWKFPTLAGTGSVWQAPAPLEVRGCLQAACHGRAGKILAGP